MRYHFKDIENGSVESAAVLDFTDEAGVKRSAVHNLVLTITNHEAEIPTDHTETALMFLAEQNGGVLMMDMAEKVGEAIGKKRVANEVKPGETGELTDKGDSN